jgi:hypothetical protein
MLFDDLKNFVDIRPIRHWLAVRVRAHLKAMFGAKIRYLRQSTAIVPL